MIEMQTYLDLLDFYNDYAMVCDSGDWDRWPEFFMDNGTYRIQPRENFERGLPLCLLSLDSKAMMLDRVYGISETIYHDPYYQRHIVGAPRITSIEPITNGKRISCEANYVVVRTKLDGEAKIFNTGFYRDLIIKASEGLRFQSRLCVYDSELIANSLIYPI